jgi:hypothetical protein
MPASAGGADVEHRAGQRAPREIVRCSGANQSNPNAVRSAKNVIRAPSKNVTMLR